jgi:hypothetical protein
LTFNFPAKNAKKTFSIAKSQRESGFWPPSRSDLCCPNQMNQPMSNLPTSLSTEKYSW